MVITVTLNPAMDKTLTIDNFNLGTVNRVSNLRYDIGGKGINVSKVLKNFGVESKCTGFLGGLWKNSFDEELKRRGIDNNFLNVSENTRTNTKVVDNINKVYTDINEAGPNITYGELNEFIEKFKEICNNDDIVVLSGGVSTSIPKDIYRRLIGIAKEKGAYVILDADGELLSEGIKGNPHVIKPNNHEFEILLNRKLENEEDIIEAAKQMVKNGIEKVLISLGEKGALFVTKDGIYHGEGLKVPVKSTVGAGDSMVAALVYSMVNSYNDENTLKFAIASGGATVSLEGTEACTLEQVKELVSRVNIETKGGNLNGN